MNELETYVASLQDQGLSVDEIKAKVIEWKKNNKQEVVETSVEQVKTEDGAVGASAPSVQPQPAPEPTELTLEDGFSVSPEPSSKPKEIKLSDYETMPLDEKRKVPYSQRQKFIRERSKKKKEEAKTWEENFSADVVSADIKDLSNEQYINLTEKAQKELVKEKDPTKDYTISDAEIKTRASKIFEENILPISYTDEPTIVEKTFGVNPFTDFLGDIIRAGEQGLSQSDIVDPTFDLMNSSGDVSDEEIKNYIEANRSVAEKAKTSDEMRDFNRVYKENGGGVLGFIKGVVESPTIVPAIFVSSMASQLGAVTKSEEVALAAAAGAGTGAAVGSVVPGIGTATGAMSGMFAGAAATMESAMTFSELLQEEVGEDLSVENIRNVLEDEERISSLINRSVARGVTIGAIEGLTGGLAKGVGAKLAKKALPKVGVGAAVASVESVGGGVGEVAGRIAADQEMDVAEIGFEAIAGTTTAPISTALALANVNQRITDINMNKELKTSNVNNVIEAFSPETPTSEAEIKISQIPGSLNAIDAKADKQIKTGEITIDQANDVKLRAREVQGSVNRLKPLGVSTKNQPAIVDLMIEQKKLKNTIKQVDNASLTKAESARLSEIDKELGDLITKDKSEKIDVGAKKIAEEIGVGFEAFETQEDVDSAIETLKEEGGEIDTKNSDNYGTFVVLPDGRRIIVLNKEVATEDRVFTEGQHETAHAITYETVKNKPEAAIALGQSLLNELRTNKDINIKPEFQKRLDQYIEDADISEADTMEEVMTLASEGLSNGTIEINETIGVKLGNFIRRALSAMGMKVKFKDGKDVLNFIKDYNRSVHRQQGLSRGLKKTAVEGVEVDIKAPTDIKADIKEIVTKESKRDTGVEASAKVQEIYDTQGVAGAFDIIEQFKPIVKRIVDKRQDAPNFDRQLLTDEIETGKRGILDLIRDYKPESGVPLAAFINTQLNNRAIEASRRVLGETFTEDVTEARGIAAEEVTTEVTEKPVTRKIKPSSFISNEAVTKIKEQIQEKIKGIDPKNLTFKKLGDLAPEIIAAEIGIPVKKLTVATANLSKGDATAIQQFVNKNADKLLKILPEGAVVEAATEKLLGTSTGVPKGLLNAFYTKQARLGKGAGLAPFKLNKGISKADFLEAFGIVEGKKAAGFSARSPQAQALKGIASLYGKLVTNEIVRSDTDLSLEAKQDVAAGKSKAMASKRNAGSQYNVDSNVVNAGYKPIKPGVEGVTDLSSFLVDDLTKVFGKNASLFAVASNLAGAGNSYIGSKPTSGAKGRKFLFISDANKTKKYIKETKEALESGKLGDLKVINNTINALEGLDAISESDLKAIKQAISSQTIKNIEGNLENKSLHDKGVRLIIEKLAELYKLDPKNIRGIASIIYNQNANYSFGRKMAAVLGLEQGVEAGSKSWEEHVYQFGNFANRTLQAISSNNPKVLDGWIKWVNDNYYQEVTGKETQAIVDATYFKDGITWKAKSEEHPYLHEKLNEAFKTGDFSEVPPADIRKYNEYFALNPNNRFINGVSDAAKYNVEVDAKFRNNLNVQAEQQRLIYEQFIGKTTAEKAKKDIKVYTELAPGKAMASKRDSDLIPDAIKYDRPITVQTAINALAKTDKSLELARKLDQPVKKIRVFDFDDTLARTKSNVLYTMPDGTTGAIDAATFAKEAGNMEAEGAQWDFSEFSKVMQGKKGPLLDVAKIIAEKRGTKDVFVLTARPANAAGPIKEFLASMGLDIPLANITGLGDGTPEAKAGWIVGKAAEGYNDFYFADDHTGNVKAVKDVLSQIDVKSKVQLAKASKRQTFDTVVNDMIEDSSGIETYKKYSAARAKTVGASKGKYAFLIPPSAEDFTGLLYKMIGKGKKGDAQMAFLKTNLLDTYNRAESAVTQAKISAANDFKALKTELKTLPKTLSKETGIGKFTYSHAVRVAAWTKQGMDIPGLSKKDVKELNDFVNKDAKLRVFTDELIKIQKGKEYPKPDKEWLGGNITTDIIGGINKVNRAEYQQEWRENIDIIFSEDNLNKMEAAYGTRWREAMVDSIRRMKAGTNRPIGGNRVTEGLLDWLNNSVGAVMFLNTRSALLQTISAVNFINWGDNNIVKAGAAFANQKQFWGDFMTLMNSDYLVERRNGLKINVSESEIADAVRESKNKPKAAIAFLLSKGFVMTRFADSFAIASGGSTFYRNRLESLKKQGLSEDEAKARAFADFKAVAEESQQSSAPSKISQQQASAAGRVILAWANTPMQYARIQKRAAQDLINNRGDWRSNVSKIVYYGAVQNLIFNALQQAVFALGFGDDEEETDEAKAKKKEEKAYKVANGMIDSQLKGLGIFGAASTAVKNTLMTLYEEYGKKGSKYENAVDDLLSFSPPLGSKIGKIKGGLRSFSWNMKDMKEKGFSLDNPAYIAGAQVVTGFTNIPLDRVAKKINNLRGLVNERSSLWQKVALGLGWGTWELGLGYYGGFDKQKPLTPKQQLQLEVDTMKKDTSKADQVKTLLDFGLTKKQIRELKNENNRVKKILELQKDKK